MLPTRRARGRRLAHPIGVTFLVMALIVAVSFYAQPGGRVWAVEVNGKAVATVKEKETVTDALESLEEYYGGKLRKDSVRVFRVAPADADLVNADQLADKLAYALGLRSEATGVKINGEIKLLFASRQEAEDFLEQFKAQYPSDPGCTAGFLQEVELVDTDAESGEILTIDEAFAKAKEVQQQNKPYTIKEGDTLWDIAVANDLSVKELLAANPGLAEDQLLSLGQGLNVGKAEPLLTVVSTGNVVETLPIAYQVHTRQDSKMALGKRQVFKPGVEGQKEVVFAVTRYNGKVVKREQVSSKVVKEPVTQEEVRGTLLMVASRGGGKLAWPVAGGGSISSYFGSRGGSHTGLDIAARTGTPIVASEAGQVVDAGWGGGYGNMVLISHGGGVQTRYAHMTKIAVSGGQQVSRGQVVGYVGSTGRTTGPHLHFEVILNGRFMNPLHYL